MKLQTTCCPRRTRAVCTQRVAVNARFKLHQVTGVQRYAHEILGRLESEVTVFDAPIWAKGMSGHFWEQIHLRRASRGMLLWNPCQTGPVGLKNQIPTIHDMGAFDHPGSFARAFALWYRVCLRSVITSARHLIAVSAFTRDRILTHVPVSKDQITVIHEAADQKFTPSDPIRISELRLRLGIHEESRIILSVGSLEPRKNSASLLQAWQSLESDVRRGTVLVFVGKTADPSIFRGLGINRIPPGVIFTGYLSDKDLPTMYSAATVFVYPSLYEGFGLPVLESMACGTPVITSNVSSLPEITDSAAILIDPFDVSSITEALRRVLDSMELHAHLRELGLARARQFSWDKAAAKTRDILFAHT